MDDPELRADGCGHHPAELPPRADDQWRCVRNQLQDCGVGVLDSEFAGCGMAGATRENGRQVGIGRRLTEDARVELRRDSTRRRGGWTAFRASALKPSPQTFRSFVTRPTSTHSTTKMLPAWSKQAPWGQTNLPAVKWSRDWVRVSRHLEAESSP